MDPTGSPIRLIRKVCQIGKYTVGVYIPRKYKNTSFIVTIVLGDGSVLKFIATARGVGRGAYIAIPAPLRARAHRGDPAFVELIPVKEVIPCP